MIWEYWFINKANLEKMAFDLNIEKSVEFIGKVPYADVPFYYQLADIYLSASTSETQGLTFIESIASKTLVLCRFDENLIDVIKDGETGFYFSDEASFTRKLNKILQISDLEKETIKNTAYKNNRKYSIKFVTTASGNKTTCKIYKVSI